MVGTRLALAPADQAAEHAAQQIAPNSARFAFNDLLHQPVVLAATRSRAPNERLFNHAQCLAQQATALCASGVRALRGFLPA